MEASSTPGADQAACAGLGAERLRHPDRGLPALRAQADRLRAGRAVGDLGDHLRPRRARRPRQLVDAADRLPEGGRLDDAVGGAWPRRRVAAAHSSLLADVRWLPLLAAPRHDAVAALAQSGTADPRHQTDRLRRRPLRRPVGRGAQPAALRRNRGLRQRRPPRPGSGRRAARRAGHARAARQGAIPRRPRRGLRKPDDHLPLPARQHDRRRAARLHLHLVGGGILEAEPSLPLRGHGDDQQHAVEHLADDEAAALAALPRRHASLLDRRPRPPPRHRYRVHGSSSSVTTARSRSRLWTTRC